MDKCSFRGNKHIRSAKVDYIYRHHGAFLLVRNVPCQECEFCGERYFSASVLRKIEKDYFSLQEKKKKPIETIAMPVEEFAA